MNKNDPPPIPCEGCSFWNIYMKYKRTTILEDKEIFKGRTLVSIHNQTGIPMSTLSNMKNGNLIPSEKWYLKLRAKMGLDRLL